MSLQEGLQDHSMFRGGHISFEAFVPAPYAPVRDVINLYLPAARRSGRETLKLLDNSELSARLAQED